MKYSKHMVSLLLALVLFLVACAPGQPDSDMPQQVTVENPVTFFSMSIGENYDSIRSLTAYANEDGTIHVEYVADVKKVGDLDAWILHGLAAELDKTGLAALNGTDSYGEGEANGSMYIEFADGTMIATGYTGSIPQEYAQGYETMEKYFAALTAELPVYVPEPVVMGEVDAQLLAEMKNILEGSQMGNLDGFIISQVNLDDEFFDYTMSLSSSEGIASAANCSPLMMTTAYSMVIVTLEDKGNAQAVCDDFEKNLDWFKWVCVAPSEAMIATKDNMVLCVMGYEALYTQTAVGIQEAGWTVVKTVKNPNI